MPQFDAFVEVRLRPGIADPQGSTIERSLPALGFDGVGGVKVGKAIRLSVDAVDEASAQSKVEDLCARFLTNPVIEDAAISISVRVMTTVGVVVFPGTNCEQDVIEAYGELGVSGRILWHGDATVGDVDVVVLPGGFAHGDYLRTGAIARFSPVMRAVAEFAAAGGPVIGICNGFQVLTEAGLLPGALQKNAGLKFLCRTAAVRVASSRSALTRDCTVGDVLRLPINHFEGNYTCGEADLRRLVDEDRIVLTYEDCPNGSVASIAGICNEAGNVVGLMPHPERACHALLGGIDGLVLLRAATMGSDPNVAVGATSA